MDTVTVKYVGPNADADKRELQVSQEEADRLIKKGLWAVKATKKKSTTNRSATDG